MSCSSSLRQNAGSRRYILALMFLSATVLIGAIVGLSLYFTSSSTSSSSANKSSSAEQPPTASLSTKNITTADSDSSEQPTVAPRSNAATKTPTFAPASNAATTAKPSTDKPTAKPSVPPSPRNKTFVPSSNAVVTIEEGSVLSIPYYHCSGGGGKNSSSSSSISDLVLLHGASFTKENWKTSGILDLFCSWEGVAVTALDLSVSATHEELQSVLKALLTQPTNASSSSSNNNTTVLAGLPISALVTPSASGTTALDWILSPADGRSLPAAVRRWIPVAANAALQYTAATLSATVLGDGDWPVLAIYGDQDTTGRQSMELLQEAAPATVTVVELPGPHAVYLKSPDAFVKTVLQYVTIDNFAR